MNRSFSELGLDVANHEIGHRTAVYASQIQIQSYQKHILSIYGSLPPDLEDHTIFANFGLQVSFHEPTEISLMDGRDTLFPAVKALLGKYGAVTLTNVTLPEPDRQDSQSNIFPDLKFHYDRTVSQGNYYSMFYRDPNRKDHLPPRTSSTLIISNLAVELEARKCGQWNGSLQPWYDLFKDQDPSALIGKILLEQRWDSPHGTGELTMVDNSKVMHASYYRHSKGYPIAVRYLH